MSFIFTNLAYTQQVDDAMLTITSSRSDEIFIEHRVALNVLKTYAGKTEWNPEKNQLPINTVESIKKARDYLRRVKGVTNELVFQNYCIKNAIVPIVTESGKTSYPRIWFAQFQFLPKNLREAKIPWNKLSVVMLFDYTVADAAIVQ